jgi:hypothetical protein
MHVGVIITGGAVLHNRALPLPRFVRAARQGILILTRRSLQHRACTVK